MKKYIFLLFFLSHQYGNSQEDTSTIFDRISEKMKAFEIDTSAVPNDKLTKKITELRNLKGGFNINEAMEYKIIEARNKKELSESAYEDIKKFITVGNGKKWIDNSIIWIYRKHFSYKEIKQLVKFYKSSTGQKLAIEFPIIMIQSVKSAEFVMEKYKE